MRKVLYSLILFILLLIPNVYADSLLQNVTFTLKQTPYTTITRRYDKDMVIFDLTNNIPTMDLTKTDLKNILSQKSGSGSSPLSMYETLDILVTPIEGTNFDPLVGKSEYYRGNPAGTWVSDINASIASDDIAVKKNMDSDFWPYGFGIAYRTTTTESWKTTAPPGVDLSTKTMEEKLATLIGIDLNDNPNGVVDSYQDLFYFRILPNGYTYKTKFDFYSEKSGVLPTLASGSTTEYLPSSLNLLDSKYVVINYHKTESSPTMAPISIEEKPKVSIIGLSIFIVLTVGTIIVFKKYGNSFTKSV